MSTGAQKLQKLAVDKNTVLLYVHLFLFWIGLVASSLAVRGPPARSLIFLSSTHIAKQRRTTTPWFVIIDSGEVKVNAGDRKCSTLHHRNIVRVVVYDVPACIRMYCV